MHPIDDAVSQSNPPPNSDEDACGWASSWSTYELAVVDGRHDICCADCPILRFLLGDKNELSMDGSGELEKVHAPGVETNVLAIE